MFYFQIFSIKIETKNILHNRILYHVMPPKKDKDKIVPNNGNHIMSKMVFETLLQFYNDKQLKIPKLQRALDLDKCGEIANKIKQNNNWLLRLSNIELVRIEDTNVMYIIDGQHRFNALLQLAEEQDVSGIEMYVKLTEIKDETEMQELFVDLNQNSTINEVYLNFGDDFNRASIIKIHKHMKQYKSLYRKNKKKGKGNHKMHFDEMINMITVDNIAGLEKPNNMEMHEYFIQRMNECNEEIKNALSYMPLENDRNKYIKETDYDASVAADWFLCYDNINIYDFLIGNEKLYISAIKK